jgi:predicted  nucleic acid-binding Zn-ribbon protein
MAEKSVPQERKGYSAAEKARIMQRLSEERKRVEKNRESLKRYLADKRIYNYLGSEYYKVKDYKHSFYIKKEIIESLDSAVQEVELERTGYTSNRTQKGFIKWDSARESILLSQSKVRIYYKPFEIEREY